MAGKRSYGDACAAAHALDLVGERWALLVIRELLLGPKRFTDLRSGLPNASPNVLAQRLRELEEAGVVRRRRLPPPAAARVYELTDWGAGLETTIRELGRWGSRSPRHASDLPIGVDSIVLALGTMFDAEAAAGPTTTLEVAFGEDRFRIRIGDAGFEAERGQAPDADVVVETDPETLASLVFGEQPLADALGQGAIALSGDHAAFERFTHAFSLPGQAPLPEPVS